MGEAYKVLQWKTPLGIEEYVRLWNGLILLEQLLEEISTNPLFLASMVLTRECVDTPSAEKDGS